MPPVKQILPIIILVLFLALGIMTAIVKRTPTGREVLRFGIAPNKVENTEEILNAPEGDKTKIVDPSQKISVSPTVTVSITPTPTAVITPTVTENVDTKPTTKRVATTDTIRTGNCNPTYGQANTCVEHTVVDTGLENDIFYTFAGLTYLAGLTAFAKANKRS
jgi:hypothetical protein